MTSQSRTKKSVRNSFVAMIFFLLSLLLQFVSRKVFINYLGTEILGLNTTLTNLLQFLNLAELGIGAAVGFSLYKPLADADRTRICEIVTLHGMLYRRIAGVIIAGSAVLMCFFPLIFKKIDLPLWYAYASFVVILASALIGYFVNYRQIVLSSAQMDYKIQTATNPWVLVKLVAQIAAMYCFCHPYEWWLALEFVFSMASAVSLHYVTRRTFPYLVDCGIPFSELRKKYSILLRKVKQLFVHKIGGFVMTQFSPIIIYAYISLTMVTLYGNYMIIIVGANRLCNAMFNSMGAGIGNLVAEGNRERIHDVFRELMSLRFIFVGALVYGILTCVQPFVVLWVGHEFLLSYLSVALIALTLFINLTRNTVDLYINAYGLYGDIWAPVVEASVNIGMSVLLGWLYGLNGILAGVLCSLVIVICLWKPYYLFTRGMKTSVWFYWREWLRNAGALVVAGTLSFIIVSKALTFNPTSGWGALVAYTLAQVSVFACVVIPVTLLFRTGFRLFIRRIRRKR